MVNATRATAAHLKDARGIGGDGMGGRSVLHRGERTVGRMGSFSSTESIGCPRFFPTLWETRAAVRCWLIASGRSGHIFPKSFF